MTYPTFVSSGKYIYLNFTENEDDDHEDISDRINEVYNIMKCLEKCKQLSYAHLSFTKEVYFPTVWGLLNNYHRCIIAPVKCFFA